MSDAASVFNTTLYTEEGLIGVKMLDELTNSSIDELHAGTAVLSFSQLSPKLSTTPNGVRTQFFMFSLKESRTLR